MALFIHAEHDVNDFWITEVLLGETNYEGAGGIDRHSHPAAEAIANNILCHLSQAASGVGVVKDFLCTHLAASRFPDSRAQQGG